MFSAGIVLKAYSDVSPALLYHPANVYPVLVGGVGASIALVYSSVIEATSLPPFELKVTVYLPRTHLASRTLTPSGIVNV